MMLLDVEIRCPDSDRFVAGTRVARVPISVGVDRGAGDPHLARRAGNAHSDLAAVGDQDFPDGGQTAIMALIRPPGTGCSVSFGRPCGNIKCRMTEQDFRRAFVDHKDAVYGFALRMTGSVEMAEDVAQDSFVELLRHPGRFDAARGSLRKFLLGVTRNLVFRRWRTDQRLEQLDDEIEIEDLTARPDVMLIGAAVQSLPPLQREALLLFEYEGFTLEEIGELVGANVGTVKARLHRAREKLRRVLAPLRNGSGGHTR